MHRLNGMFALAIWDTRSDSLFLARDRLGEKPLYYADLGRRFLFGSELKALLAHPACPRRLDERALAQYLALEYVPAPDTILDGVRKLDAGHSLTWRSGRVSVERYWSIGFEPAPTRSADEWAEELRERLDEAVGFASSATSHSASS